MKRFFFILLLFVACKQVYNPPLKNVSTNYLVAEGNIIAGNDSTFVHLTRTTPVTDSANITQPEANATVQVEGDDGEIYNLENTGNGYYAAPPLNINAAKNYRLHIFTGDGKEYASDFVPVKITPPIDSISWKFDTVHGVNIYVSTHDATSKTLYYQWNFTETWQHHTSYTSGLIYDNGSIRFRTPDEYINNCWTVLPSPSINVSTTSQLSSDVLYETPLVNIPYGSEKISIVYSIQVKQYAITKEAFEFWQNLKKNTEQLGTIFDPQPFADFGNIHCITNPAEPVIGFISANSIQKQRIYIRNSDLPSWNYQLELCATDTIPPANQSLLEDGSHIPLTYVSISGSPVTGILIAPAECADCRLHGGSTVKPPYMP